MVALHWFTSDLRLADNPALAAAPEATIAGVFVLDPESLRRAAGASRRVAFMRACLASLDASLRGRGSRLVVLDGDPARVLPDVVSRVGARVVTHAVNHEPAARRRAERLRRALAEDGVEVRATDAGAVRPAGTIVTGEGGPYRVYGPFARAWDEVTVRALVRPTERWVPARTLAPLGGASLDPGGVALASEAAARDRLATFIRVGLAAYATRRDLPGVDGTSRLSAYFRFGVLSPVEAYRRVRDAAARRHELAAGAAVWLRELAWRDFFAQLLRAHPQLARAPMRPTRIRWRTDARALDRWCAGTTGIPLVDAGMRELATTGFMHNRVRMVTASFLTRHLLIDWRAGERHFARLLLDHQVSQNNGNWQWVAGTGTDAQPFHRIFSPVRQGERFDPEGAYVKRWIPELARVPAKWVHQPWTLTPIERRSLCADYPPPVVDLDEARARALAAWEAARRPQ